MFVTFGAMITWPTKKSNKKEMKKAYCGFSVALRRPTWKSREKKSHEKNVNAWYYDYPCTEDTPPTYVDAATESSPGALLHQIEPLGSLECFNGGSCAPPSTSMVEEKCYDGSGTE